MSDEQPPELGSRRRRREIREAREREGAAQRERDSAVRRLSSSSTADSTSSGRRGTEPQAQPAVEQDEAPALFDQETSTPKDQRRSRQPRQRPVQSNSRQSSSAPSPAPAGPAPRQRSTSAPSAASSASAEQGFVSRRERRRLQTQQNQAVPPVQPPAETAPAAASPQTQAVPALQQQVPTTPQQSQEFPAQLEHAGLAETPAPAEPSPVPSAMSPATPFEHVVAPHSAASPESEQIHPAAEHPEYQEFQGYHEEDWAGDYQEHEYDEDGTPVLVGASGYGRGYQTVAPMEGRVNRNLLKQRKAKRRRRNITLGIVVLVFGGVMFWLVTFLQGIFEEGEIADYDQVAGETVEFEIYPEEGLASVQQRLVDEGIVASPEAFQQALEDLESDAVHHDGTYILSEQMPAAEAVEVIFAQREGQATFSVPLGSHQDDIFELIAGVPELNITVEELQELAEDPQQFGLPEQAEDLEGFLAGGDHYFEYDATAEEVLQEVVSATFTVLEEAGVTDPDEQWETIIVASLITAEANNNYDSDERTRDERYEDYRIMAGAIQNRIDNPDHDGIGGLLQIDAAVHYGSGRTGDLHFSDEERFNEDNEYNTYVHPGLPPSPIGAPIWDTIRAAAAPADTSYFYWVTVNPNTGETEFNETHDEHLEDVAIFNQFCEDNPGACSPAEEQAAEEELEE